MADETTHRESGDETRIERDDRTRIEPDLTMRETGPAAESRPQMASFKGYRISKEFPAAGGEADIFLLGEKEEDRKILKLYRLGINPREEVLKKAKELSDKFPGHIVMIYDCGYDVGTGRWYEIQEYALYGAFKEIISSRFDNELFAAAISDIIEGLKVLHDNNILHLDLKPSNILIRRLKPLDLVFTDFGIASMLDPELSKKMTTVKGTPLYWSPEAFTGVVGKEADYWSLGMIALELLLGKHPFAGLDTKVILYTLSTKGISIPDRIQPDYRLLLKGLLTREPKKRWGYREVKRWLKGERNIPVHYASDGAQDGKQIKPYKFLNADYYSVEELLSTFLSSEQAWEDGKQHLARGYIARWLESNEDYQTGVKIEQMKEKAIDPDRALIAIVYSFHKELPFVLFGRLITLKNLHIFAAKDMRGETSGKDEEIVACLADGRLLGYYEEYLAATGTARGDLYPVLALISRVVHQKTEYPDKVKHCFRVIDVMLHPGAYLLPKEIAADIRANADFIARHLESLMKKDECAELMQRYILPQELTAELTAGFSKSAAEYAEGAGLLRHLEENDQLLPKDEYELVVRDYILPEQLRTAFPGTSFAAYRKAAGRFKSMRQEEGLIKIADFTRYLKLNPACSAYIEKAGKKQLTGMPAHGTAGEQRWIEGIKSMSLDDYKKISGFIRNNVVMALLPLLNRLEKELPSVNPNISVEIMTYIEVLKSARVGWDDMDKTVLKDIQAAYFGGQDPADRNKSMLDELTRKDWIRTGLAMVTGMEMDDDKTMKTRWALGGSILGLLVGALAGAAIKILKIETNIFGLMMLGILPGLVRRSGTFGLAAVVTGLIAEIFFGNAVIAEMGVVAATSVVTGGSVGAFFGRKKKKVSSEEKIYHKYSARINDVLASKGALGNE